MNLYEHIPQKNSSRLSTLCITLFIGSAVVFGFTTVLGDMPFRWVFQLIALGMLTAGVFVTSRYIMKSFIYRIEQGEQGADLTVTEIQNRHRITVCRISVCNVENLRVLDDKDSYREEKKMIKAEHRKYYDYCPDPFPRKKLCLRVTECGESLAVFLSYDKELENILGRSDV